MGKFKVGDVVKFKSQEELMKITLLSSWEPKYKTLAGKAVKICEIYDKYKSFCRIDRQEKFYDEYRINLYFIQYEQEKLEVCFPEYYFEELNPSINVLVET